MNSNESNLHRPAALPSVPWGVGDLFWATLLAAGGIVALYLVLLAIGTVTRTRLHADQVLTLFVVAQDSIVVGAALLFSVVRYRVGWDRLGWRAFNVPLGCGLSALLLMMSYAIRFCYAAAAVAFNVKLQPQEVLLRLDTSAGGILLTLFVTAVLAPIAEETFFRGFLYGGLRGRIGMVGALFASTLFFTALHLSLEQFIPIFVLGLFLGWLYETTGSLFPGILLHMTNNAVSLLLLFLLQAAGVPIA